MKVSDEIEAPTIVTRKDVESELYKLRIYFLLWVFTFAVLVLIALHCGIKARNHYPVYFDKFEAQQIDGMHVWSHTCGSGTTMRPAYRCDVANINAHMNVRCKAIEYTLYDILSPLLFFSWFNPLQLFTNCQANSLCMHLIARIVEAITGNLFFILLIVIMLLGLIIYAVYRQGVLRNKIRHLEKKYQETPRWLPAPPSYTHELNASQMLGSILQPGAYPTQQQQLDKLRQRKKEAELPLMHTIDLGPSRYVV